MKEVTLALTLWMVFSGLTSTAYGLCVKSKRVSLRKGPGTHHQVTWRVGRYMPLKKLRRQVNWIKVEDLQGRIHWVHHSQVTTLLRCVVVKAQYAKLRTKAKSSAPEAIVPIADRFTPFKKIDHDENWVRVEDRYGHRAWIHEGQLWAPVTYVDLGF